MQEFLLFFQQQAGQRGGIGPVGKIAHQYGTFRQGQGARPLQDVPLFVRADDPPAVEDRTEHPAGAQGREGRFQRGGCCCLPWRIPRGRPRGASQS